MLESMTGFGKAVLELPEKKIIFELRSLNSKSFDLNVRIPSFYREKELEVRSILSEKLNRGKVDLMMISELKSVKTQKINTEIIQSYISEFKSITPNITDAELLPVVMRMSDVMTYSVEELDEEEWDQIKNCLNNAIDQLSQFRRDEGNMLSKELSYRVQNISDLLQEVDPFEEERIQSIKERYSSKLEELKLEVDQSRFEQEMIFYIEKLDITEEKVRLKNHCEYFLSELNGAVSNGRKLGFISQEIGREINTLGSKSNHSEMQKIVVQMKDELEKIKEQVLNVL